MSAYRVEPNPADAELLGSSDPGFFSSALGYSFMVYLLSFPVVIVLTLFSPRVAEVTRSMKMGDFCFAMMKVSGLVGPPLGILACSVQRSKRKRLYVLNCAASIEQEASAILENIDRELSTIKACLRETESWIDKAKNEQSERACTPFLDAVALAAEQLALCRSSAWRLKEYNEKYHGLLSSRRHSFPLNPLTGRVPDPSTILAGFNAIVRRGQVDRQFGTSWERRATRNAAVAGFSSFGEAVNNVSDSLSTAFTDLNAAVSRGAN